MKYETTSAINARIAEIDNTITSLNQEKLELNTQLEELAAASPEYQLAIHLHDSTCKWNHTDGCSWYYEFKDKKHVWTGHAHSHALKQAQHLIAEATSIGVDVDTVLKMSTILSKSLKV